MKAKEHKKMIITYTDGAGAGPDGRGSAFAWVNEESGEKHIERVPGLTNNMAEYGGVIPHSKSCGLAPVRKYAQIHRWLSHNYAVNIEFWMQSSRN
jgi:hypothetical protein